MNNKQENTFSMLIGVGEYLEAASKTVSSLPTYGTLYGMYKDCLAEIGRLQKLQVGDKSGATDNKKRCRETLVGVVADVSRKLSAYARIMRDEVMLKQVKFLDSELNVAADTKLTAIGELLYDYALQKAADLLAYDLTATEIAQLRSAIDEYKAAMQKPSLTIKGAAQITKELGDQFAKISEHLEDLDALVEILRMKEPSFYEGYLRVRKVSNLGGRSVALKVKAKDANGQPIAKVRFELLQGGETPAQLRSEGNGTTLQQPLMVKKTSDKGGFQIKHLPDGTYTALVKKLGYRDQEVKFHVVDGEMVNLHLVLEAE